MAATILLDLLNKTHEERYLKRLQAIGENPMWDSYTESFRLMTGNARKKASK